MILKLKSLISVHVKLKNVQSYSDSYAVTFDIFLRPSKDDIFSPRIPPLVRNRSASFPDIYHCQS